MMALKPQVSPGFLELWIARKWAHTPHHSQRDLWLFASLPIGLAEACSMRPRWNGVWLEERLSVCENFVDCVEVDMLHPRRRWLCCCDGVWWNVIKCAFWCWPGCAVLLALFGSGGRSKFIGEWASLRNWMGLLCVIWISGPLSILYAHFWLSRNRTYNVYLILYAVIINAWGVYCSVLSSCYNISLNFRMERPSWLSLHSLCPSQRTLALAWACIRPTNNWACTVKTLGQRRHLLLLVTETQYVSQQTHTCYTWSHIRVQRPTSPCGQLWQNPTYRSICESLIGNFFFN